MNDDIAIRVARIVNSSNTQAGDVRASWAGRLPVVNSLGIVDLVVRLENEFGLNLRADQITTDSFASIDTIADLIRSGAEDRVGVHDYLRNGRPIPAPTVSVIDALRHRAIHSPDAPVLTWLSQRDNTEVLTYAELDAGSRAIAARLARRVSPGECVGLLAGNDIDTAMTLFAVLRIGAVCMFLNPVDSLERLRGVLATYPVRALLHSTYVDGPGVEMAEPVSACADGVAGRGDLDVAVTGAQPAFMFSTSGSTSVGKMVLQSHRALASNAAALTSHLDLGPDVTLMGGLPLHHVNGVHFTIIGAVVSGAHTVLPQRFSPLAYREQLHAHQPNIASVVPSMMEALLTVGRGWSLPESLRYFVSAAAPLNASLARRISQTFNRRVVQGYGLTETTNFTTMMPVNLTEEQYAELVLDAEVPTVGLCLGGNEVEILSPAGAVVGDGEIGEVCVRGHAVMERYVGEPELTAQAFYGNWFHTGDLGRWRIGPDGRKWLFLVGRIKNVAKIAGEQVSLEAIEHVLLSLGMVGDAGCIAVAHALRGEEIVAFVCSPNAELESIKERLASVLSAVAVPTRWVVVESLPRTSTGKLIRSVLRDRLGSDGAR